MDLKFYLNKILKIDNIENYTLDTLSKFKKIYDDFLEETDGIDPEYLGMVFGGKKGKKIKGNNIYNALQEGESVDDFRLNKLGGLGITQSKKGMEKEERQLSPDQMRNITREDRKRQSKK